MMNLNLLSVALVLIVISTSASVYINEELPLYLSDDIIVSKVKRSVTKDANTPVSHDTNDSDTAKVEAETTTKDNPAKKELTNEESGLVFLPSFGRRTRRNIVKRETTDNDNLKTNDSLVVTERNEELTNPEDRQESGLVFLPSFGRRNRRSLAKRSPPSRDDDYIQKTKTTNTQETENESEDEQESGLVFIPSFGRRTKRNISKRDVSSNKDQNKKNDNSRIEDDSSISGELNNEFEEQESGLVFIPSFGRRTRRHIAKREASSNGEEHNNKTSTVTQKPEKESEDEQESGLVFLPSFGRRTKRHILNRRDISSSNKQKDKSVNLDDNSEENSKEFQNEEESGLVFIPSFGRRSRREASEVDSSQNLKEKSQNLTTSTENTEIKSKPETEGQESGLVFLPSFGRRTRREV